MCKRVVYLMLFLARCGLCVSLHCFCLFVFFYQSSLLLFVTESKERGKELYFRIFSLGVYRDKNGICGSVTRDGANVHDSSYECTGHTISGTQKVNSGNSLSGTEIRLCEESTRILRWGIYVFSIKKISLKVGV